MLWSSEPSDSALNMTEDERVRISSYIENEFGIKMSEAKKPLLTGRLSKRLRALKIKTFGEYFDYIHTKKGVEEYRIFTDLVSTHETSFFREISHFDYLTNTVLPALYHKGAGADRDLRILSAACSSGEEVYSSACIVEEYAAVNKIKNFKYSITGTDISLHVVRQAVRGIYNQKSVANLPVFAHKYFMRSKDPQKNMVRVVPEIREHTSFMEMNLLDDSYPFDKPFDVIFCRNVMIYFDRKTQEHVAAKLCNMLASGGYFLVGHSETLMGFPIPVSAVAPASYLKN